VCVCGGGGYLRASTPPHSPPSLSPLTLRASTQCRLDQQQVIQGVVAAAHGQFEAVSSRVIVVGVGQGGGRGWQSCGRHARPAAATHAGV
jgi:hypothetical protein